MDTEAWLRSLIGENPPRGTEARELARMLVAELGHPQRSAPAVHIVGTAGKGTVAALLTQRLVAGGRSVATHQSPHVVDIRERFLIEGELPAADSLATAVAEVRAAATEVERAHGRRPTFFAATAAISWVLGRQRGVDLFVTEAGIGGRLDATSVLDRADTITVITHIGLDHRDVLGATVREIAAEKVAVLEGRRAAVLGPQRLPEAVDVARAAADRHGVELTEVASPGDWRADAHATVDAVGPLLASAHGIGLGPGSGRLPPGRYQVMQVGRRRLVLDGAHNPDKLAALASTIATDRPVEAIVVALGRGKDLDGAAALLARLGAPVFTCGFDPSTPGRVSWSAVELADALRRAGAPSVQAHASVEEAVAAAFAATDDDATVLVTGSFLILEPARAALAVRRG